MVALAERMQMSGVQRRGFNTESRKFMKEQLFVWNSAYGKSRAFVSTHHRMAEEIKFRTMDAAQRTKTCAKNQTSTVALNLEPSVRRRCAIADMEPYNEISQHVERRRVPGRHRRRRSDAKSG